MFVSMIQTKPVGKEKAPMWVARAGLLDDEVWPGEVGFCYAGLLGEVEGFWGCAGVDD
jgi:hypothetical protein